MQNIRKKNRSKILAGLLCIALLIGMMPFNAINAHAADGKITIRVGERIDYSSHFTTIFTQGIKKALFTVLSRSFQRRDRERIPTAF